MRLTSVCSRTKVPAARALWPLIRGVMRFTSEGCLRITLAFCTSNTLASELPPYEGNWRHNSEKTAKSILSTDGVPQHLRDYVEKQGYLFPDTVTLVFDTDAFGVSHDSDLSDIKLYRIGKIEHTASHFRFKIMEPGESQTIELTIFFENDCIYYYEGRWKHKSYFCK